MNRGRPVSSADGPVRVMHVVYSLQPGGMEFGVVKLVNGLDPASVRSAICSTKSGGALKPMVSGHVQVFEMQRRSGNDPGLVWDLFRLFRRERPDVVHTHAWGTLIEGLVAARLARVPFVVHGEHGTLQLKPHQRWFQRRGWAAADRVLSVSSRLAERIAAETAFPLERIRVLRNGVDLARFGRVERAQARSALGLSPDEIVVTTVGRLVPVKDHPNLLGAVALARQEGAPVTLVIAGDGPLRADIEARAEALGISSCLRFLGHRADVEVVFAASDVFTLSSESEGLSNTILEAMAAGLPVVATRVGGADELVLDGVTGLLVPRRSSRELADALVRVVASPDLRASMSRAGRERAVTEFGLDGMIRRYETLYRELAGLPVAGGAQPPVRRGREASASAR